MSIPNLMQTEEYDEFGRKRPVVQSPQIKLPVIPPTIPSPQVPIPPAPVFSQAEQWLASPHPVDISNQEIPISRVVNTTPVVPDIDPIQRMQRIDTPAGTQISAINPGPNMPLPQYGDPAYHNSKLRTVLNAIAGGLAGAVSPQAGIQVGEYLHDMKYNNAMKQFNQRMALLQEQNKVQKQGYDLAEKAYGLESQRQNWKNLADIKSRTADIAQTRAGFYGKDVENRISYRDARKEWEAFKAHNPSSEQTAQWILNAPDKETQDARYWAVHGETSAEKEQTKIDVRADPKNLPKERAVAEATGGGRVSGTIGAESRAVDTGALQKITGAKTTAQRQAALDVATDPVNIKRQADLTRAKSLATLTTNEKDTIRGAQVALQAFPDIREQLSTASDKILGNRWQEFLTGTIGHDPEFAPLRENIGLLQSLVAKLHVGSRGSVHILNKFETLFNAKQMDRATLESSLNELEKWLNRYATAPSGTDPAKITIDENKPGAKLSGVKLVEEE